MADQNTVFKASDAEICVPVTKLLTNDRMTIRDQWEFYCPGRGSGMEQTISLPDQTASRVNRFAASNDISIDRAYELLVSVGIETLDGMDLSVSVENQRLILECPGCASVFDSTDEALAHECETQ